MAKKTADSPNPRRERTYDGMTRDELAQALELDFSYDDCIAELFADLGDDIGPKRRGEPRVTQMGPGRRNPPKGRR